MIRLREYHFYYLPLQLIVVVTAEMVGITVTVTAEIVTKLSYVFYHLLEQQQ